VRSHADINRSHAKDVPGELVRILTPIADVGGNVISIIHKRDEQSTKGRLPVRLTFDIDSRAQYEKILERYKNENTRVMNGGEIKSYREIVVGMIGHIVHTDLSETIKSIDSLDSAMSQAWNWTCRPLIKNHARYSASG